MGTPNLKDNEFAILHQLPKTQALVDTTYNHDEDKFELRLKWWCKKVNGYAEMKLSWDKQKDFTRTFNEMKESSKVQEWIDKFEAIGDKKNN